MENAPFTARSQLVRTRRSIPLLAVIVAVLVAIVAGCGSDNSKSSNSGSSGSTSTPPGKKIKGGLVTGIRGPHDRSFNPPAYEGVQRAASPLGISGPGPSLQSEPHHIPKPSP